MPALKEFRLPDLGEGLTDGEIIRWLVGPGDTVVLNQPIVEVETAKAAVEVPSPYAGVVRELHHAEGDTVDVGAPLLTFDVDPDGAAAPVREAAADSALPEQPIEPGMIGGPAPGSRTSVLVGYGPKSTAATRRPRTVAAQPADTAAAARVEAAPPAGRPPTGPRPLAKPPVRRLARDLGVDLAGLAGSGPDGVITRDDIAQVAAAEAAPGGPAAAGVDQRIPVRGVRKLTAANMVASAFTAPHVTEFLTVDLTPTMALRDRLAGDREFADVKLTPLVFVAKALLLAVRRHPMVNSTWEDEAQEIVVKSAVNLGIAAATPRGLIVPNLKDAGRLGLRELAVAIAALTDTARAGRTAPADMTGGTITITNVGVFGVDTGTPILNPGESAILCFGAVRPTPWVHEGEIAIRQVTQLGLSFDHRVIDGQLGSQFLADIGAVLAEPATVLLWS